MPTMTAKPLLWSDDLLALRATASIRDPRNRGTIESLDRHLARVHGRRLFALSSYAKLSK